MTFERAGIALQVTVKRDVVGELKYRGLQTLNKNKFKLLFNTTRNSEEFTGGG